MQLVKESAHERANHTGGHGIAKRAAQKVNTIIDELLESRTFSLIDACDPTTMADEQLKQLRGYGIFESPIIGCVRDPSCS